MKTTTRTILFCICILAITGCQTAVQGADVQDQVQAEAPTEETSEDLAAETPEGWSEETHGKDADPDYETVFPQDEVNRIDITIEPENWELMMADMTENYGEFGTGRGMGMGNAQNFGEGLPEGAPPEGQNNRGNMPPQDDLPEGSQQPQDRNFDRQPQDGGNLSFSEENPVWVTGTIEFEGDTWEHVGIRFKGNSSLQSAWSSGSYKIPFKLDFDQFEDDYPEIEDQRFYGFKQLSLANNFNDDSYLREKVTADIFREFGVPSANTAFYEVYVDYGEGSTYLGLYAMVELVEDTVIDEQFSDNDGNLYKPEGTGATFAEGSFSEESFDKETNQEEVDYSDILALFEVLHAENRLTDPETWREDLESVFDVDTFLRWLAVNTAVQNWDTYGVMSHNYFLYTNPENGLITWIPWDNNHAIFESGKQNALSLSLDEVTDRWPLIRFLMDDPTYQTQYESYLGEVVETVFEPEKMAEIYQMYHDLVAQYVLAETPEATTLSSAAAFNNSVGELISHTEARYQAVQDYLSE